jgi:hypothetical protein
MSYPWAWSSEREDQLRKHHAAGLSFKAISEMFRTTRCAIAGKCARMKLTRPGNAAAHGKVGGKISAKRQRKPKINFGRSSPAITPRPDRAVRAFAASSAAVDAPPLKPYSECVTFMDLKPHHCRFPVDGAGDRRYCGEDKGFQSYCLTHHAIAHRQ